MEIEDRLIGTKNAGIIISPVDPVRWPSSGVVAVNSSTGGVVGSGRLTLGASGDAGYNVIFSTIKSFYQVYSGFKEAGLISPKSIVCCDDEKIGWYNFRLEDLLDNDLIRLSQKDDLWIRLIQKDTRHFPTMIQDVDPTKLVWWWYESIRPPFKAKTFAVNLSEYDGRVLEIAYRFTNHKITDEVKATICSMLNEEKQKI